MLKHLPSNVPAKYFPVFFVALLTALLTLSLLATGTVNAHNGDGLTDCNVESGDNVGTLCHVGDNYCNGCECENVVGYCDISEVGGGGLYCNAAATTYGHGYCNFDSSPRCGLQPGCGYSQPSYYAESSYYSEGSYGGVCSGCGPCTQGFQICKHPNCTEYLQSCAYSQAGYGPPYSQSNYYSQGFYYSQASYCTPAWSCETPYNGFENDGCGARRANASCNPSYIQAGGASVHSNASIIGMADSAFPAGSYFNPGQAGVVSSMGAISFSPSKTNSKLWQLTNYPTSTSPIHTNPRYDHDYFWNLYKNQVTITVNKNDITNGDLQVPGSSDPEIIVVHPVSGNTVRLKTPGNITGGKLTIVFVNNLNGTPVNFSVDSRVQVDSNSFVIFIVSGNVTIDSTVDQADGYYLSTGSYSSGSGAVQLNVSGGVAAYGGIILSRRNSNTALPSEAFTYNPLITKFASKLGESAYSWTETIP